MHSNPALTPTACYICGQSAQIEPGRNSYLVNCGHCGVKYEIDLTAWTTPLDNPAGLFRMDPAPADWRSRVAVCHQTGVGPGGSPVAFGRGLAGGRRPRFGIEDVDDAVSARHVRTNNPRATDSHAGLGYGQALPAYGFDLLAAGQLEALETASHEMPIQKFLRIS